MELLYDPEKYDTIYNRITYLKSKKQYQICFYSKIVAYRKKIDVA